MHPTPPITDEIQVDLRTRLESDHGSLVLLTNFRNADKAYASVKNDSLISRVKYELQNSTSAIWHISVSGNVSLSSTRLAVLFFFFFS